MDKKTTSIEELVRRTAIESEVKEPVFYKKKRKKEILLSELQSLDNFIVFSSNRDGNYEIYKMNAEGSNQERLTYNSHKDIYPSVSGDGKEIAFSSLREDPDSNRDRLVIYVMRSDGSDLFRFFDYYYHNLRTPVWSHDGKEIAFYVKYRSKRGYLTTNWYSVTKPKPTNARLGELTHKNFYFENNKLNVNGKIYTVYSMLGNIYVKKEGVKIKIPCKGWNITPSWGPPIPILKDKK